MDLPGLRVRDRLPEGFWRVTDDEVIIYLLNFLFSLVVWAMSLLSLGLPGMLSYWDGPNYIYAGITLYRIPDDNPWTQGFQYPPSYFACHFPGMPLVIRLCSTVVLNNAVIGTYLAVILVSTLLLYVFKRLLIAYDLTSKPDICTGLLVVLPLRYAVYHSVVASEPLFLLFCFLAFIFFRVNRMAPLWFSICGACITRIEGLAIWGTIGLCYLLRFDIKRAIIIGFCLVAPLSVFGMHQIRFGTWKAYFAFNQGQQGLISLPPFIEIVRTYKYGRDLLDIFAHDNLMVPFFVGLAITMVTCVPLGIFSTVYFLYVGCLRHIDTFRYALPGFVPAVIIGFERLWTSREFRSIIYLLLCIYLPLCLFYMHGQITSNVAPAWFTNRVLDTPPVYT